MVKLFKETFNKRLTLSLLWWRHHRGRFKQAGVYGVLAALFACRLKSFRREHVIDVTKALVCSSSDVTLRAEAPDFPSPAWAEQWAGWIPYAHGEQVGGSEREIRVGHCGWRHTWTIRIQTLNLSSAVTLGSDLERSLAVESPPNCKWMQITASGKAISFIYSLNYNIAFHLRWRAHSLSLCLYRCC